MTTLPAQRAPASASAGARAIRALIYTRVSSDPRGLGRSVAEQEADCRAIAATAGWDVIGVLTDNDRSASRYATKARPKFTELVAQVEAGECDVLLTWEASRFQRDLEVYVQLRETCRRADVLWSYSGRTYDLRRTDDRMTTGLDALLAERESDITRERVARAMKASAAAGRPHGRRLYGYRRVYDAGTGCLVGQEPEPTQAAIVREVARRVARGEATTAISRDLNRRGIPGLTGQPWEKIGIRRMVTNPAYIGQRCHRGKVVGEGIWTPLLDDEVFYTCVGLMRDPARMTRRDGAIKHLLTGVAKCGICGHGVSSLARNGGQPGRVYACRGCFGVTRLEQRVDDYVEVAVQKRLAMPDALDLLAGDSSGTAAAARAEAAEKRARLGSFYDAAAAGSVSPAALARIEARLLPEIKAAESAAHQPALPAALRELAGADAIEKWPTVPITVKRQIITWMADIRIMPLGKGGGRRGDLGVEIAWRTG